MTTAALTARAARQIDAVCDRFEEAIQDGKTPPLENYLSMVEESLRPAALRQLLLLEWEYRVEPHGSVDEADYLARFPEHSALIHSVAEEYVAEMTLHGGTFAELDLGVANEMDTSMRVWKELGYVIQGRLGRGGAGSVYLAFQPSEDRLVAVKLLRHGLENAAALERFRREIRALERLEHPHIVPIFDVGQHQGRPFYSMEYCSAGSLAEYLSRTTLTSHEAAAFVETLAGAVHAAHQARVIHRDLKPSNVLLQSNRIACGDETNSHWGDSSPISVANLTAKLADFGLAKKLDGTHQTQTGDVLGTPQYMAPEQARGDSKEVDVAVDIHGLGAILYECLTGRPPYLGATAVDTLRQVITDDAIPPTRFRRETPSDLETICLKCLRKEPHARYRDAASLAEDLRRFRRGEAILARPISVMERTRKWVKRHPAGAGLLGVLILAGVLGFGLATWALGERATAVAALARAERQTAIAAYEQAVSAGQRYGPQAAILWLARALESAVAADADDLEESIRWQLGAWSRDLRLLRWQFRQPARIMAVDFSPDGKLIVTAGHDNTARIFNAATGKRVGPPLKHQDIVYAVAFSPDGNSVVTGCGDGNAQIWKTASGKEFGEPLKHGDRVLGVAFSLDGKTVLTGSHDETARLWDAATGQPIGAPIQHPGIVRCVAFSPDGETFVTGCDDGVARLWETATAKPLPTTFRHPYVIFAAAFSPNGDLMLTGSKDRTARLWKVATGKPVGLPMVHQNWVMAVDFHPRGNTILTAGVDHAVRLWEAETGQLMGGQLQHEDQVRAAVFSPDGKTLLTGCYNGTARLWDVTFPTCLQHPRPVRAAVFGPDANWLQVVTAYRVDRWNVALGNPIAPPLPHRGGAQFAVFSPDGRKLLTRDWGGKVRVLETATANEICEPPPLDGELLAAAFSADGKLLLTGCKNGTARLWDAATGQPAGPPLKHENPLAAVAVAPDGKTVVAGTWDRNAQLWEAESGNLIGGPLLHFGAVNTVAFSPDGRLIVTGSADQTARLWDAATGKRMGPPMTHGGDVRAVTFSPDSKTILTVTLDRTARLWEVASGRRLGPVLKHRELITATAFSPDGRRFLTGCHDGAAYLWRVLPPVMGEPKQVTLWAQVNTGMELDKHGGVRVLDAQTWAKRRQELRRFGGPL